MNDTSNFSDEEIVEKVRSYDQNLYAVIVDRYKDKLLRYAKNIIRNNEKAVDIVQDSFANVFVNLKGFDTNKKFSSWIYRIVHNEAINIINKNKREVALPEDIDFESGVDIEKEFEQKEIEVYVEKCLESMPIMYSEPLSLYYLDQKSYAEISEILRIPMGTVAIRISRAKKIMKKICQKI